MADILDQVMEFLKLHPERAQIFFDKLKEAANHAGPAVAKAANNVKEMAAAVKELTPEVINEFKKIQNQAENFVEALGLSQEETGGLLNASAAIFVAWKSGLEPKAFSAMTEAGRGFNTNLIDITGNLGKITSILSNVLPEFAGSPLEAAVKMGAQYAAIAQPARDLESGLLAAASASGELGDFLNEVGENMSGLTDKTVKFTNLTYNVAQASGHSVTEVGKYATELSKIPGALSDTVDLTGEGVEKIHLLDATMKAAAGTGQTFSAVFDDMNHVYREFGTTGKQALEYVTRLSAASQALKMPLDLVKDYTRSAAQSFKFLGDNSQGAINVLGKFGSALKDSGLGPKAIADLTKGVIDGIGKMSIAQNAFLSQTAGGVGGLQGAIQIDLLKKAGKVDEVQKMVEASLRKQFGGRIVTQEEGGTSQAAAAQYTKQVQLLTTGPTAIAGDKDQAARIIEAMSKGEIAKAEPAIKGPQESLQVAVEKGNTFQERQYSALTTLSNLAEKQVMFAALSANNIARLVTGKDSPLVRRFVDEERATAKEKAATTKMITGVGPEAKVDDLGTAYSEHYTDIKNTLKKGKESVEAGLEDVLLNYQMKQMESVDKLPSGMPTLTAPGTTGFLELPEEPLPSPRRQVAGAIGEPKDTNLAVTRGRGAANSNEATVKIQVSDLNDKKIEDIVVKIVNNQIAGIERSKNIQPFTGSQIG